jgi:hypothetical protein
MSGVFRYHIRRGTEILERARLRSEIIHSFWVLVAHDLMNGRDPDYYVFTDSNASGEGVAELKPVNTTMLQPWVIRVLRAYGHIK